MDVGAVLCLTILGPFFAIIGRNDSNSITRERCSQCKGKGVVVWS